MKTLIALALFPLSVFAANTHEIEQQGVKVTLTDEPCTFPQVAHILPFRATWTETGKVFEGCFVEEQKVAFILFPPRYESGCPADGGA